MSMREASPLGDDGAGAPRVGADLRAARGRLGRALPEMASALCIRLPYLEALEDGRIGDLPGTAYALGFLRAYADSLGLDPDEISRRFKIEADEVNHKTELEFPAPIPSRAVPAGAMVLLGVVLAVGAYIGWYRLSGEGRLPAETVAPMPERLASLAEQASPPISAPPTEMPPAAALPAVAEAAQAEPPLSEAPSLSPSQAAAALPLPPPVPPALPASMPASAMGQATSLSSAVPTPAASRSPAQAAEGRIVVRATADVWIQLRERGGPVIFNHVLKAGETYAVPNRPNLLFTTGNALGTELLVDGAATPGLGAAKGVRRDLVLDADMIKAGRLASELAGAQQPVAAQQPTGAQQNVTRPQ